MATLLNSAAVESHLKALPDWHQVGNTIQKTFVFRDFVTAIAFVNRLVEPAESAGHHPDLSISYNKVTVSLSTHDAGGLTEKDFALAAAIAGLEAG